MKNKLLRKKDIKKNKNNEKAKKVAAYIVVGIILFAMIFGSFSYLIYALQSV